MDLKENKMARVNHKLSTKPSEYKLNDDELEYLMAVNELANRHARENTQAIGAFLKFVCTTRLGYDAQENLQFEIDFDSDNKKLKVTTLEK